MDKAKKSQLSPEARVVWDRLDEETKKVIQKDNPFLKDRNQAILELRERGIKWSILTEITGLSRNGIIKIVAHKERLGTASGSIQQRLKALKKAFEVFYNLISVALNGKEEKGGSEKES